MDHMENKEKTEQFSKNWKNGKLPDRSNVRPQKPEPEKEQQSLYTAEQVHLKQINLTVTYLRNLMDTAKIDMETAMKWLKTPRSERKTYRAILSNNKKPKK